MKYEDGIDGTINDNSLIEAIETISKYYFDSQKQKGQTEQISKGDQ